MLLILVDLLVTLLDSRLTDIHSLRNLHQGIHVSWPLKFLSDHEEGYTGNGLGLLSFADGKPSEVLGGLFGGTQHVRGQLEQVAGILDDVRGLNTRVQVLEEGILLEFLVTLGDLFLGGVSIPGDLSHFAWFSSRAS